MAIIAFLIAIYSQAHNTHAFNTEMFPYSNIQKSGYTEKGLTKYNHIKLSRNQCMPEVISIIHNYETRKSLLKHILTQLTIQTFNLYILRT